MPFNFNLSKDSTGASNASVKFSQTPLPVRAPPPVGVYAEYQVERAASPLPSNPAPRYPDEMRSANVDGVVLAQFVVNENGTIDSASFRALHSTSEQFTNAVRAGLSSFRFNPALVGGHPVKQLVQMPFQFSLSK